MQGCRSSEPSGDFEEEKSWRSGEPVSYTHLDVYKRQFLSQNLQGGQLTDIIAQLQAGLQQLPKVYSNVIGMAIDTDSISQALNLSLIHI